MSSLGIEPSFRDYETRVLPSYPLDSTDREGFEPSVRLCGTHGSLANSCLQPLSHLSIKRGVGIAPILNRLLQADDPIQPEGEV